MSDQLEAEVQETVVTDDVTIESTVEAQTETTSDTVSDSEEKHEEKSTFTPEQKATAGYAFEARQAKRENEELRQQLAEAQQPESVERPAVPEIDDYSSEDEIKAFGEATRQAAVWDYQQEQQKAAEYQAQVAAQNQQQEQSNKLRNEFITNATTAGIKLEDLQTAGNVVTNYGLNPVITQAMMQDKEGGLMLLHLATDPQSIEALNGANMLTLGTVYADIKAKAATLKPKQSEAPPPAEILSGNGAPPKDGGPDGATYE